MKHKLPSLILALAVVASGHFAHAQGEAGPSGEELVAASAESVYGQSSISARLRYRIDIFGQQLIGSGAYLQLGYAEHKKTRLELKIQIGEQVTSVQQICDDRYLWVHRHLPAGSQLSRCDLLRVRRAMQAAENANTPLAPSVETNWMALGGLSKMLDGLEQNFEFGPAQASQLQDVPVYITEGAWDPQRLAVLVPAHREAILAGEALAPGVLPQQLPERVRLVLGRDDHFPYRIEYLRRDEAGWKTQLTMEFFEVQLGGIPPRAELFVYEPGEQEVVDITDQMLEKLGLPAAGQ